MQEYDVVILGGGPSGLRCAEILGNSKFNVLLLDKKEIIGPKTCAGGLTVLDNDFKLPEDKSLIFKKQAAFLNGKKYILNLITPIHTIDRLDLGQHQLSLLKQFSNIQIRTNCVVEEILDNQVRICNNEIINFKYLIGADGSSSIVRKHLGLKSDIYMGIQYVIPNSHPEMVWFLNTKLLKSGYGWIFPHKNSMIAGVYYNPRLVHVDKAKEALHQFLNEQKIDYSTAKFEGAPTNCSFQGFQFNNIFLAGDAAGLVSKTTGEGIAYALTSGEDIARHILDNNYEFEKINKIIKYKKRQELILSVFDTLPSPAIQSFLFSIFLKLMKRPAFQRYFE